MCVRDSNSRLMAKIHFVDLIVACTVHTSLSMDYDDWFRWLLVVLFLSPHSHRTTAKDF